MQWSKPSASSRYGCGSVSPQRQLDRGKDGLPDVAVREVPPADGLCVVDVDNFPEDFVFADELVEQHVVRGIAQHMADGEEDGRV